MSYAADLPASCRENYDARKPLRVNGSGLAVAGQQINSALTWTGVPEADVTDFLNVVCGTPESVTYFGITVTRIVPLRHPLYPDFMIAQGFDCEALPIYDGGAARWAKYRITVDFHVPPFSLDGDQPYTTEAVQPSSRQIQAPAVATRIGGVAPIYDPGREIPGQVYTVTTHNLPSLPISTYMSYVGHANSTTFLGCPIGTVLYRGPSGDRTTSFGSAKSYTVGHNFDISEVPWNNGYKPDGTLAQITNADGSLRHPLSDLAQVFA